MYVLIVYNQCLYITNVAPGIAKQFLDGDRLLGRLMLSNATVSTHAADRCKIFGHPVVNCQLPLLHYHNLMRLSQCCISNQFLDGNNQLIIREVNGLKCHCFHILLESSSNRIGLGCHDATVKGITQRVQPDGDSQ